MELVPDATHDIWSQTADAITAVGVRGVGERRDGRQVAAVDFCLLLPLLVWLLVLNKTLECVRVKNLN